MPGGLARRGAGRPQVVAEVDQEVGEAVVHADQGDQVDRVLLADAAEIQFHSHRQH